MDYRRGVSLRYHEVRSSMQRGRGTPSIRVYATQVLAPLRRLTRSTSQTENRRVSKAIDSLLTRQAQNAASDDVARKHAIHLEEAFRRLEMPFVGEVFLKIKAAAKYNNSHPQRRTQLVISRDTPNHCVIQVKSQRPGESVKSLSVEYDSNLRTIIVNISTATFPVIAPAHDVDSYTLSPTDGGIVAARVNGPSQGYATTTDGIADEVMTAFLSA
jgi:hypothetical protein